ncbi:ANTAR domain-containing response regulator [Streptomyces sp. NPDC057136]|uniref:ANTAR domain-containing response regulator n=1 Tax=Streptomyces sp. NPDC057136 TaxID=3346029 RepID=UPI0036297A90
MSPPIEVNTESASAVRRTTQLSLRAREYAPACCGTTVTLCVPGGGRRTAATHPDLAVLARLQETTGAGPDCDAFALHEPVASADLVADPRWPRFRSRALGTGLRACLALPVREQGIVTAVTLYAFRPNAFPPSIRQPLRGLVEDFIDGLLRDHAYASTRAEVQQLKRAVTSHAVIDRASGIVMRVVGCDADQAFAILRAISQGTNLKLSEIAEEVVEANGRGLAQHLRLIRYTAPSSRRTGSPAR